MSLILAADTSTSVNTVALCRAGPDGGVGVVAESVVDCSRRHAERIIDTVDWVLAEGRVDLGEVDLLAVANGPGSFTGLRIGVAAWKGLAFGGGIPLVAVPTLDALARVGGLQHGVVCPLLDARMDEVFGAVYRIKEGIIKTVLPARACAVELLLEALPGAAPQEPVLFLGDGAERYRGRIEANFPEGRFAPPWQSVPRASAVAAEGWALLQAGAPSDPAGVAPVYLRKPRAQLLREAAAPEVLAG